MANTEEIDEVLHDLDLAGPFGEIDELERILERLPPLHPRAKELAGALTVRRALEGNIEPPMDWPVMLQDQAFARGFLAAAEHAAHQFWRVQ